MTGTGPSARSQSDGPIDWGTIRSRLERTELASRGALEPTPEQARAVLEARARALARVPLAPPDASAVLTVVTFALADEPYAIETRYVRRVVRIEDVPLTPIPGTPDNLAGVINMGGEILAVFDLGRLFGLSRAAGAEPTRILVLGEDRNEFGLLADAAHEVRPLRIDAVLEAPGSLEGIGRSSLRGVTADALIVLDGAALLRDPKLVIDQGEEAGP
jgi:purine-binding chemotaxis protein CheW